MREIRKILFIRTDKIGDVLMNLPAIRLLRQSYPKSWITLLADRSLESLLSNHSDTDELMTVSLADLKKNLLARLQLIQKVRRIGYDLVLVSNPDKFFHLLAFFAGIPVRVGYARKWGFLLNKTVGGHESAPATHEIEKNLTLAKLVSDKKWDGTFNLSFGEEDKKNAESLIGQEVSPGKNMVLIHPGTSDVRKKWPADHFAKLCATIQALNDYSAVLVGGLDEKETSASVASLSGGKIADWTGRLSLGGLKALMINPRVKALVSVDSGPAHIAWMSGLPVVILYAKNLPGSNPERWGPRQGASEVIYKDIHEITVAEVFEALKRILSAEAVMK